MPARWYRARCGRRHERAVRLSDPWLRDGRPGLRERRPHEAAENVARGYPAARAKRVAACASPIQRDSSARPGADVRPALALQQARARKLRTYPELQPGGQGRCRLVVFWRLAGDSQALALLGRLARARARDRAPWASVAAGAALTQRWTALASLAALRARRGVTGEGR